MIGRSQPGSGTVVSNGLELLWNYRLQGLSDSEVVEVALHGIEMVYVPGGPFWLGSGGNEPGRFYHIGDSLERRMPFAVGSDSLLVRPLSYSGSSGTSGSSGASFGSMGLSRGLLRSAESAHYTGGVRLPADFPVGYKAFYMMKYELSQSQYRDFLNDLPYSEQHARTNGSPDRAVGTLALGSGHRQTIRIRQSGRPGLSAAVFGCDANQNGVFDEAGDGQGTACNYLNWADLSAYLDWAGLRPITEGEFEKACRGSQFPGPNEFPWGSAAAVPVDTLRSAFSESEHAAVAANCVAGNQLLVQGPARVGAAEDSLAPRLATGRSWYGIADLGGNVREWVVEMGHLGSLMMLSVHGDGYIGTRAVHDVPGWPDPYIGEGMLLRGGSWADPILSARVSAVDTSFISTTFSFTPPPLLRLPQLGGRGGRSVSCILPSALTDTIRGSKTPDFDSYTSYSIRNAQSFPLLWQMPGDMEVVGGQASDTVQVYTGRAYGTLRVAPCNECGCGAFTELAVTGRVLATGGVVSSFVGDGNSGLAGTRYVVHSFTENGVFRPNVPLQAECLLVAGGGGGGQAGGGAGGVVMAQSFLWVQDYPVVVGTGGAAGSELTSGGIGGDSQALGWRALGGGGGGSMGSAGLNGGCGGGGGALGATNAPRLGGQAVGSFGAVQGSAGGLSTSNAGAAGGGGFSAQGVDGGLDSVGQAQPGKGGAGLSTVFSGVTRSYAGGGGGGGASAGQAAEGGMGGGGNGGDAGVVATCGQNATGSGGGGAASGGDAGSGGKGVVVIRYILQ
jgi:formylglycine-generating enzyme required for sulfatase activity